MLLENAHGVIAKTRLEGRQPTVVNGIGSQFEDRALFGLGIGRTSQRDDSRQQSRQYGSHALPLSVDVSSRESLRHPETSRRTQR